MEARKITVVSTKNQKKSVIMSGAETLGELKSDLTRAGIDFEDMTFYEGTSRVELVTDSSHLPTDVPYTNRTTGETIRTNELVFMLTNTNKKIKSGANRPELYNAVKDMNLQQACINKFGKNYTHCSNTELTILIDENSCANAEECCCNKNTCVDVEARKAIDILATALYTDDIINKETYYEAISFQAADKISSPYSDNEIDEMFKDML